MLNNLRDRFVDIEYPPIDFERVSCGYVSWRADMEIDAYQAYVRSDSKLAYMAIPDDVVKSMLDKVTILNTTEVSSNMFISMFKMWWAQVVVQADTLEIQHLSQEQDYRLERLDIVSEHPDRNSLAAQPTRPIFNVTYWDANGEDFSEFLGSTQVILEMLHTHHPAWVGWIAYQIELMYVSVMCGYRD